MLEEFLFEGFPCRALRDALDLAAILDEKRQIENTEHGLHGMQDR